MRAKNIMVVALVAIISTALAAPAMSAPARDPVATVAKSAPSTQGGVTKKARCKGDFWVNYGYHLDFGGRKGGAKYLRAKLKWISQPGVDPLVFSATWGTKKPGVIICRVIFYKDYRKENPAYPTDYRRVMRRLASGSTRGRAVVKAPAIVETPGLLVYGKLK